FTIVFTLQEDYKEIGIMKAIGIRDNSIKGIYLLKYLAISVIGAFIGLLLSFPFEKLLINQVIANMVTRSAESNILLNIGCAVLIVVVVLVFCYSSTGKVKKFSAIEAIRNGSNGERFKAKTVFRLHKRKVIAPSFYMACNDVVGNVKRFVVLAIIFCIGTLEILLPLTAIHTLKDESIITSFDMQQSDAFIETGEMEQYMQQENNDLLINDMKKMEEEFADAGMDGQVWDEIGYMVPCYSSDPQQTVRYIIMQVIGNQEDDYDVLDGRMPQLQNEIMITELTAKELSVGIGDSIYFKYPDKVEEYVITGTFQSLMNMGNGFRISHNAKMDSSCMGSIMAMQVKVNGGAQENNLLEKIQEVLPDYQVLSTNEYISSMIGGVLDKMDSLKLLIVAVVIVINVLITILIMKMLITKERGEIAMLKSVGFSNRTLKAWQSLRILLVLVFSMVLGVVLVRVLAPVVISPIFAMMGGTSMKLIINPIEAYVIFPLILLVATGVAAWLCAWDVNKVDLKEINTLE
ncbi:MAG TPA: ABC transporter permease, partial [Lachnospiraceae bacterium]|nr:ABC transporter permease [Lachnospiraceae bacterium]